MGVVGLTIPMLNSLSLPKFSRRQTLLLMTAGMATACGNAPKETLKTNLPTGGTSSGWSEALSLPQPVQEIYPCYHNGRIHQAGGFIAKFGQIIGPTAAHYSWAAGESTWRAEMKLPRARHHPHMISFKDQLLAIAGFVNLEDTENRMETDQRRTSLGTSFAASKASGGGCDSHSG